MKYGDKDDEMRWKTGWKNEKNNYLKFVISLILSRYNNLNHANKGLPSWENWNA